MAWQPNYVEVADLKHFLKIPVDDVEDDVELALAIPAASRAVDLATGRQFGIVDAVEERVYEPHWDRGRCTWVVAIDDLMTETGLVVSDGTDAITDYTLEPRNAVKKGKPWTRLAFESGAGPEVTIEASWGWTAVPEAIEQATLLQASRFFSRRTSPYGVAGSPDLGNELRLLARVDPDVAVTIAPYIRWWGAM